MEQSAVKLIFEDGTEEVVELPTELLDLFLKRAEELKLQPDELFTIALDNFLRSADLVDIMPKGEGKKENGY